MLRRALAGFALFALTSFASADDAETKKTVKGLVEKMQSATLKGEYEAIIDLTHPKVIEQLGGRAKALAAIKDGLSGIKDQGFAIKSLKAGEPAAPLRGKKDLYTVVPTTLEMTAPQGKVISNGFLLGASSDDGKTWTFVDGAPGPDVIRKMFPDLPEKLTLPKSDIKIVKD